MPKYQIFYLVQLNQFVIAYKEELDFYPLRIKGKTLYKSLPELFKQYNESNEHEFAIDFNSIYSAFERKPVSEFSTKEEFQFIAAEHLI